ncbi:MAG: DUF481 domain-containing protein [Limisphaerales bacterium]
MRWCLNGWGMVVVVGWLGLGTGVAQTVVLHLRNGDRLTGTILSETANQVVVRTTWKEKIAVPLAQIERREKLPPPKAASSTEKTVASPAAAQTASTADIDPGKQARLDVLLELYQADKITPLQYHEQRARLLSESAEPAAATAGATLAPPVSTVKPAETASAKSAQPSSSAPAPASLPPSAAKPAPAPAAQTAAKKPKNWNVNINIGANAVFNQTESQLYTVGADYTYVRGRVRESAGYQASYGKVNSVTSANRMYGSERLDADLGQNKKFFAYNLADAGYDQILKIDLQYGDGPGLGYHLIARPNYVLNLEAGGKYAQFKYSDGRRAGDVYLRLAENSTWQILPKATLKEEFAFLPRQGSFQDYQFRLESTLSYALSTYLSLNLHVLDFYDTFPGPNVSHNNLQIDSTIGIKF